MTTRVETLLAIVLGAAAVALVISQRGGLATMLAIGFAVTGLGYACSPLVALVAEHDLEPVRDRRQNVYPIVLGDHGALHEPVAEHRARSAAR